MLDDRSNEDHPSKSLEQALDFMAEVNGSCCDPRHYHSFRGVSFLLPMRTCGVCAQRLLSVVPGFSTHQVVVQCLACKMLAHRTCALSKNTQWSEPCPVNFRSLQVSHSGNERISIEAPQTIPDGVERLNDVDVDVCDQDAIEPPCTNEHSASICMLPEKCDDTSPIRIQAEPSNSLEYETESGESSNRESVSEFRSSPATKTREEERSSPRNCTVKSEGATAAAGNSAIDNGSIASKESLPILSASSLFRTKSAQFFHFTHDKCSPRGNLLASGDGDLYTGGMNRSQTWSGPEACTKSSLQEVGQPLLPLDGGQRIPDPTNDFAAPTPAQQQTKCLDDGDVELSSSVQALEWTAEGPPVHWAAGKSLEAMLPVKIETDDEVGDAPTDKDEGPLHFSRQPFSSVSRALHGNILVHFRPVIGRIGVKEETQSNSVVESASFVTASPEKDFNGFTSSTESAAAPDSDSRAESNVECMLDEAQAPGTGTDIGRLGLATVAGGIAGGVAGMVVAGPVGGVIGAKFGQTFGILGLVLEGSLAIGVITSGIAAGRHAGQQLQDKINEDRVLALSGSGTDKRIILVRPTVKTDPAWGDFCEEAKKSHQKRGIPFKFLQGDSKAAKRERYEREMDIVTTDEIEIPTADKVLLLVSRILNNKESMPGHVYRQLIEKVRERAEKRGPLSDMIKSQLQDENHEDPSRKSRGEMIRARRQDAHAVIKHVTATVLEVRPVFATSPTITEFTATAVEGLVFGQLYDLVMEEIEAEFEEKENELLEKVATFERRHTQGDHSAMHYKNHISEEAVEVLHNLPEAHSAVDKLRYCVTFLEKISEFFSSDTSNEKKPMGADSLLKLVCQHIIAAKVFGINAQVAFLDEFARDEHLLRGKEGYALVSLQASLHFLNASSDFHSDIFEQEDD